MKTTMHRQRHGRWTVTVDGFVVGVVERSSKVVRFPKKGMARTSTWVAFRRTGMPNRRRVGGHVATRREAVTLLVGEARKPD